MKIAFICDYYFPFEVSGAEISTRVLAVELTKADQEVIVVTPKYDISPSREVINKVFVKRFPLFLRKKVDSLSPLVVNNPLWLVYTAFQIIRSLEGEKVNILHVQNKNLFLSTILANIFLRKPIVATARDYRYLCDLGVCLLSEPPAVCTDSQYLCNDIPKYISLYKSFTASIIVYSYIVGLYNLMLRKINKFFLRKINRVICVSNAVERIYNAAGIANTTTIYNLVQFQNLKPKKRKKQVLFAGRFTPGKGRDLLNKLVPIFLEKFKDWEFIIASKDKINLGSRRLISTGWLSHDATMKILSEVSMVIIPSQWPEPLSRVALDALSVGTPIISSRRGGMPEIVSDGVTGFLADYSVKGFVKKIAEEIPNLPKLLTNISKNKSNLNQKFFTSPLTKYLSLCTNLITVNHRKNE